MLTAIMDRQNNLFITKNAVEHSTVGDHDERGESRAMSEWARDGMPRRAPNSPAHGLKLGRKEQDGREKHMRGTKPRIRMAQRSANKETIERVPLRRTNLSLSLLNFPQTHNSTGISPKSPRVRDYGGPFSHKIYLIETSSDIRRWRTGFKPFDRKGDSKQQIHEPGKPRRTNQ